jgi:hypothetical protein
MTGDEIGEAIRRNAGDALHFAIGATTYPQL